MRCCGSTFWTGGILRYDTRDNPRYPGSGTVMELQPITGVFFTRESTAFQQVALDVRHFVPLHPFPAPNPGRPAVLALRSTATLSTAATPRHTLPAMGGQRLLRGYAAHRFVANHAASLQAEFRMAVADRLTVVAFGAAGVAVDSLHQLLQSELRYSGGGGLRLAMNRDRDVNLRLDTGFSPEGMRVYLTLMEAF